MGKPMFRAGNGQDWERQHFHCQKQEEFFGDWGSQSIVLLALWKMELFEVAVSEAVQSQVRCSPSPWADHMVLLAFLLSSLLWRPTPAVCGQLWYLCARAIRM